MHIIGLCRHHHYSAITSKTVRINMNFLVLVLSFFSFLALLYGNSPLQAFTIINSLLTKPMIIITP